MINRIRKFVFKSMYQKKNLAPCTNNEEQLMDELRSSVRDLPKNPELEKDWQRNIDELIKNILGKDVRSFLEWSVIKRTMFFEPPVVEWQHVKKNIPISALTEDKIGDPDPYFALKESSGNLIHHAYSLSQIRHLINFDNIDLIVEFGGGYGSMCRLIKRLGYKKKYLIFDLPVFSCLQRYFLESCFGSSVKEQVLFTGSLSNLNENVASIDRKKVLFIGTWSLSESPITLRNQIVELLGNANYLIAFQNEFASVDNQAYFLDMQKKLPYVNWESYPVEHLPGHSYLVGLSK